jgi:hypothetical protein
VQDDLALRLAGSALLGSADGPAAVDDEGVAHGEAPEVDVSGNVA